MPEGDATEWSTAIPLRGNASEARSPEQPNPYSRLEAVEAVRLRLAWLAEHLEAHWETVPAAAVAGLLEQLGEELHAATWGALDAVQRVRAERPRSQLTDAWDDRLDPAGPL